MVHLKEITSPPRVAPSVAERGKQAVPAARSSSMPQTALALQGRAGHPRTSTGDAGAPPTHAASHVNRPRSNVGIRIQSSPAGTGDVSKTSAATVAKSLDAVLHQHDRAAQGILKMWGEPKGYVDDAQKSVTDNLAAVQAQIRNLQDMLRFRDAALGAQAELRKEINQLDGHEQRERYNQWAQAASVNLEAVFQEAEAAVSAMQARLAGTPESDADSDTDVFMDALSDWDADLAMDTETEAATETETKESVEIEVEVEASVASIQSEPPKSAASPRVGEANASTQPVASASSTEGSAPASPTHVASTAAAESAAALAQRAADEKRHETAQALLSLRTMNMTYHVSGVLELLENVQAMGRKIQNLEQVLASRDELLQGHGDLVEQLADETVSARLDLRQFKQWRDAAAMNPGTKFSELAASISDIKARMRNGVEHLTTIEGYSMAEIFPRSR
ncbi:hypothetical protein AVHY2522_06945 [Acidovorax sp. SUPP2522]|uniref:hypothetical protein n=1 Tax=unclassified Acidovorax TaxID=2684926 RepID=UPI002349ED59|nr:MULTISPECIES: hypothetical protein [unclassified Acidovorax]WCM96467.1 hypothetical protein M5C96_18815 [Acidovorax sp. GBBC 1281]GKT15085.1 hypothetical protein AVHY2522_06945 [Acidovorax sp. SUPP2522]